MMNLGKEPLSEYEVGEGRLYSIKLINTPGGLKVFRRWLLGIFIFLVLCLFLPWQQNIRGSGSVTALSPADRPQSMPSIIAGRIEFWNVAEGQKVNKGDTLVIISEVKEKYLDTALLMRIREQIAAKEENIISKQSKVEALDRQIGFLKNGLGYSLDKARNKVKVARLKVTSDSALYNAARADFFFAKDQYRRADTLFEKGLIALNQLQNRNQRMQDANYKMIAAENSYTTAMNELINAQIELNSLSAEYFEKISKAESDREQTFAELAESQESLSKLRNELSNMTVRQGFYTIRAPLDAYVVRASRMGIGETIKEGEELMTLQPARPSLAAEVYIKALDLPVVYVGAPVRIQFEGWPALVFSGWPTASVGTFAGIVNAIDRVAGVDGKFRMLIVPDTADIPWPEEIRVGSGVYAWTMLNDVPVWYEIWRQLNSFPPDLTPNSAIYQLEGGKSPKGKSQGSYDGK